MRLHDFLDFHVRDHPSYPFAIHGEQALTYGEAADEVHRLANAFVGAGLQKGDRIAVLSRNRIEYLLTYLAGSKTGVVPVPMNFRLAPPEWLHILRDSKARVLLAEGLYCPDLEPLREDLDLVGSFIRLGDGPDTWTPYEDWVRDQPTTPPDRRVTPEDDLYQMYTSGTTGRPKGAVIRQSSVAANTIQTAPALPSLGPGDRYLMVAPIYHAAAAISFFAILYQGASAYIQEEFDPARVVNALSDEKITGALMVPAMIQACLVCVEDVYDRSYDDLDVLTYGAAPISEQTLLDAQRAFKCDFVQGYGMTETTAVITLLSAEDHLRGLSDRPELLTSAGRPVMGTDLRIVDKSDRDVPLGETGQILVRGPQVMRGYWRMPDATADALAGDWMHTGDAGKLDEEGYLYIMDRVKDMIISGGENVYPRVVEDVVFGHPDIADVAVIGVPDEQWGESIKAIIVLREGRSIGADELIEFCRGKLGGFQIPRSVAFVDELPRNPSGKVLKRVLRQLYWSGKERKV